MADCLMMHRRHGGHFDCQDIKQEPDLGGACDSSDHKGSAGILPARNARLPAESRKQSRARCPRSPISQVPLWRERISPFRQMGRIFRSADFGELSRAVPTKAASSRGSTELAEVRTPKIPGRLPISRDAPIWKLQRPVINPAIHRGVNDSATLGAQGCGKRLKLTLMGQRP